MAMAGLHDSGATSPAWDRTIYSLMDARAATSTASGVPGEVVVVNVDGDGGEDEAIVADMVALRAVMAQVELGMREGRRPRARLRRMTSRHYLAREKRRRRRKRRRLRIRRTRKCKAGRNRLGSGRMRRRRGNGEGVVVLP